MQKGICAAIIATMAKKKEEKKNNSPQIRNKKAFHDYVILEKVEAGLSLTGSEVKSLRLGNADLNGAYAKIVRNECLLVGAKIEQYKEATYNNHETTRDRKLLLHRSQIKKLTVKLDQRGFTLVPLRIYFNSRGLAKLEIALARGKQTHDKRASIRDKDQKRDLDRSMKSYRH